MEIVNWVSDKCYAVTHFKVTRGGNLESLCDAFRRLAASTGSIAHSSWWNRWRAAWERLKFCSQLHTTSSLHTIAQLHCMITYQTKHKQARLERMPTIWKKQHCTHNSSTLCDNNTRRCGPQSGVMHMTSVVLTSHVSLSECRTRVASSGFTYRTINDVL